MQNIQKAAELLRIPQALQFTNGLLVDSTTYSIKKLEINDFTQGPGGPVVTISFSVDSTTTVCGVQPNPQSAPNSSLYAFNTLSGYLAPEGFGFTYTGETNGVHRLYIPHSEGIDTDPLSGNYNKYVWYNWHEVLIEQTGPTEVTWTARLEPGINTYGYFDATTEHPIGSPTPPADYSVLKILVETTSQALTSNGLSTGAVYTQWVTIQEILDNSNWTIDDIVENTRGISRWNTDVDHTQKITSVAVEVSQVFSTGASRSFNGDFYLNGILHSDLPTIALETAYYTTFNGAVKRWIHYNQYYQTQVNTSAWFVQYTGNTWHTNDDCHIIGQYEDINTIDWANNPPGADRWLDGFDYGTRIMRYTEGSYFIFEIEELPGNSHNFAVGVKINLDTGAVYSW